MKAAVIEFIMAAFVFCGVGVVDGDDGEDVEEGDDVDEELDELSDDEDVEFVD